MTIDGASVSAPCFLKMGGVSLGVQRQLEQWLVERTISKGYAAFFKLHAKPTTPRRHPSVACGWTKLIALLYDEYSASRKKYPCRSLTPSPRHATPRR